VLLHLPGGCLTRVAVVCEFLRQGSGTEFNTPAARQAGLVRVVFQKLMEITKEREPPCWTAFSDRRVFGNSTDFFGFGWSAHSAAGITSRKSCRPIPDIPSAFREGQTDTIGARR
jgi:hypothetical protein